MRTTISARPATLKSTTAGEFAIRFLLGGGICVAAGLVSKRFGPVVGGLMLAFPAIFPCSATLLESHETRKKVKIGYSGTERGRLAAAVDADGSVLGALALGCFAALLWWALPRWHPGLALPAAAVLWLAVSFLLWRLRRKL